MKRVLFALLGLVLALSACTSSGGTRIRSANKLGTIIPIADRAPAGSFTGQLIDLLYRRMKSDGVQVVGIDTKDAKSNARAFVRSYDISYPIVFDETGEIQIRMGAEWVRGLPFSILLDKSGDVAALYLGQLTVKDLRGPIASLRAEQKR
jgi:hypothetical protein